MTYTQAFMKNFLGSSPDWYKLTIIAFLVINPILFFWVSPFVAGWLLVAEFIFTLAMALKCYPLQPGGLLAVEAIAIGMTNAEHVKAEIMANFEVVLLLIFMVAGIYFMKQLLLYVYSGRQIKCLPEAYILFMPQHFSFSVFGMRRSPRPDPEGSAVLPPHR